MKIEAYDVTLASAHSYRQHLDVSERLAVSNGANGNAPAAGNQHVQISPQAQAALEAEKTKGSDEETGDGLDPRLQILKQVIERLTGRPIKLLQMADLQPSASADVPPSANPGGSAGSSGNGFSLAYDFHGRYEESEQTAFAAEGKVRTGDGREISFSLSMVMSRSYSEQVDVSVRMGDAAKVKDPLALDFDGTADALSSASFQFDLDADGSAEEVRLPVGGSGILVFDRNNNGKADDGSELFGTQSGDGFADLSALDSDGNGWIDENDSAFDQLKLWDPSQQGTTSLKDAGIGALYLGRVSTPFQVKDSQGETLAITRASSIYLKENGQVGTVSQVDLAV